MNQILRVRANIFDNLWSETTERSGCSPQYSEQSVCTFTYQFPSALQQVLHAEPQMTRLTVPLNILNKECAHSRNNSPLQRFPSAAITAFCRCSRSSECQSQQLCIAKVVRSETWSSAFFESSIWRGWLFPSMNNECAYSRNNSPLHKNYSMLLQVFTIKWLPEPTIIACAHSCDLLFRSMFMNKECAQLNISHALIHAFDCSPQYSEQSVRTFT